MEEAVNEFDDNQEIDEEEKNMFRKYGDYNRQLVIAAQKGDLEWVKKCLDNKANIDHCNNKNWTAIVWASSQGYVEICRYLLEKGADKYYLENIVNKKVAIGQIDNNIRSNPLQWACFKGKNEIIWILLKQGFDWKEIDGFGNNCMHHAASGDYIETTKILMMWGAIGGIKNTRGHEAKDLATNQEIIQLLEDQQMNIDNGQIHWCSNCKKFYQNDKYDIKWVYETHDSEHNDKLDGKCLDCRSIINEHQSQLRKAMDDYRYEGLKQKIDQIKSSHMEVDSRLLNETQILLEKLRTQDMIMDYINSLKRVDNYKTIMRSVGILDEKYQDAQNRQVKLDQNIIDTINSDRERLVSERNLQFQLDNLDPSEAIPDDVKNLEELIQLAKDKKVDDDYIQNADTLRDKLSRNIKANDIFKLFAEYPFREYPIPMMIDPKTKKPIDPVTKKPIDPKSIPPPPKKKKKEPKFIIPEWATEIESLKEKIDEINEYIGQKEYINLTEQLISENKDHCERMKKELRFRKDQEEEARLLAEAKAAAKKKK